MAVHDIIGVPATLELCAEECVELAHVCLKLARGLRRENPTDADLNNVRERINEEVADVLICIDNLRDTNILRNSSIFKYTVEKTHRRNKMLKEKENEND